MSVCGILQEAKDACCNNPSQLSYVGRWVNNAMFFAASRLCVFALKTGGRGKATTNSATLDKVIRRPSRSSPEIQSEANRIGAPPILRRAERARMELFGTSGHLT